MRKLLSIILAVISSLTYGQNVSSKSLKISGRVVSALTGDPIPYCHIYCQTYLTESDSLGFFKFTDLKAGNYKIHFQAFDRGTRDTIITLHDKDLVGKDWLIYSNCRDLTADSARSDIQKGRLKLFLQSGDPPIIHPADKRFRKKYKVCFYEFGDLIWYSYDCLVVYNQITFRYLDDKFGKRWRKEIRPNVPGYKADID